LRQNEPPETAVNGVNPKNMGIRDAAEKVHKIKKAHQIDGFF
jgi:hypothetical protein